MNVRLSVVIPSLNGGALLRAHLPEIVAQLRDLDGGGEVVVSDDGSDPAVDGCREGTREVVAEHSPIARLVEHDGEPTGFSGACLRGARAASGRLLAFFNNDMHPEPGCLSALAEALDADDRLFAVTPVILNAAQNHPESSTRIAFAHGVFDVRFPGREGEEAPAPGLARRIAYGCGGAVACRADRFAEVGGFCEIYAPFYWEDADLGFKARRFGWEIAEIGSARARHEHAQTIGALFTPDQVRLIYERNRWLFTWLHLNGPSAWFAHLAWCGPRVLAGLIRGAPQGRAFFDALERLGSVRAERRRLRESRRAARALVATIRGSGRCGWPADERLS
jgi:GT2 family glycosyltransferase